MRLPGAKGLRQGAWRLRGRVLGGAVILGYHRVSADPGDPWGLCLDPDVFASQLDVVRNEFRPVRLDEAIATRSGPMPVAVTFDDGYADVLTEALPLLERFDIPATVFVVPGVGDEGFWWDRLRALLDNPQALPDRLDIAAGPGRLEWSPDQGADTLRKSTYRFLRALDESTRSEVLDELASWAAAEPRSPVPVLDHAQLATLSSHPLVEIGSHTMSHADLSVLDGDRLEREIRGSRDRLEEALGHAVESFSYPHGGLQPAIRERIRDAGYLRACSSVGGLVQAGSDPFRLPRLWPPAASGARFRAWLRSWTGR